MRAALLVLLLCSLILAAWVYHLWARDHAIVAAQKEEISKLQSALAKERAEGEALTLQQKGATVRDVLKNPPPGFNARAQEEVFKSPDMRKVKINEAHKWLAKSYMGFFRRMQLQPDVEARVSDLMADRRILPYEIGIANREAGNGRTIQADEMGRMIEEAAKPIDAELRALLGGEGFDYYQRYTRNAGARALVDDWMTGSGSGERYLSDEQIDVVADAITDLTLAGARAGTVNASERSESVRARLLEAVANGAVTARLTESQTQLLAAAVNRECDAKKDVEILTARLRAAH